MSHLCANLSTSLGSRVHVRSTLAVLLWVFIAGCRDQPAPIDDQQVNSSQAAVEPERSVDEQQTDKISEIQLRRIATLIADGQYDEAAVAIRSALLVDAQQPKVLVLSMQLAAATKDFDAAAKLAMELAHRLPGERDRLWLSAFDWSLRAGKLEQAEQCLLDAIRDNERNLQARHQLVQLLNALGRRFETREHVLELIRERANTDDELMSLIDLSGPFVLVSYDNVVKTDQGTLFQLGQLRKEYGIDHISPQKLIPRLAELRTRFPSCAALIAFQGRVLLDDGDMQQFGQWANAVPEIVQTEPEYWYAIGEWWLRSGLNEAAIRCLSEAILRDPSQREALRSLAVGLDRLGQSEQAKTVRQSLATLDKIHRIARDADPSQCRWIADELYKLGRPLESSAWLNTAVRGLGGEDANFEELQTRYTNAMGWEQRQKQQQVAQARTRIMLGFDWQQFPLEVSKSDLGSVTQGTDRVTPSIDFVEEASTRGLKTTYVSGLDPVTDSFRLFQINGGGIAVLDYDRDGQADIYFAQAGGEPRQENSSKPNQLFRLIQEGMFQEIPNAAGADDRGYGQGVCAGDLNQDGFIDLCVGNIGQNRLFMNQGDGTFVERSGLLVGDQAAWTSSIALVDLNGDALPDLVEANYIDDVRAFDAVCKDDFWSCQPQRFNRARDAFYFCQPDGSFRSDETFALQVRPDLSFGIIAADFDQKAGNDCFISVDGDLNFFWRSANVAESSPGNRADKFQLKEAATVSGVAVGKGGNSQACMGIASGDFNRDGCLDLFVTNFFHEANNLFIQNLSGSFSDEVQFYGLAEPSHSVLGFGTQATDLNNDGWQDIAVLNGHIYNARDDQIPFRMRPQLFSGSKEHFAETVPRSAMDYWNRHCLGRTLATLDWNRDGRVDLVANHLDAPVALLTNASPIQHWLQFELVGVQSEREAIGARVRVDCGNEHWWGWSVGGDGYMCTNEPVIHFGLGEHAKADRVEIQWPSGKTQVLVDVKADQRLLVIEGQDINTD